MGVVGGAADDGIESGVIEAVAPVFIGLGVWKFGFCESEVVGVHIAEGGDVLCFKVVVVHFGATVGADEGDVEFLVAEAETGGGEYGCASPGEEGGGDELPTIVCELHALSFGLGLPTV